ncbi:flagellar hook capping FlgD N-terminal domain-containing protein [Pukyongiella litopenaei]|nr:flagellar hook capping FlgD N-terminal domain-containing protein [Pukyongiella litopenaei]
MDAATPVQAAQAGSQTRSETGARPALTSDFETFLKMLTAQARYQDPLEPIDSTEYAAQLAQFSMVEQQVQTNDTLARLAGSPGFSQLAELAGWVGMEARVPAVAGFRGVPITVSPNPDPRAEEAFLIVADSDGREVQRLAIPVSSDPVEWAGVASDGQPLAHGTYSFSVESHAAGEIIATSAAQFYGRVTETQIRDGSAVLILEDGQVVQATDVTALRQP